MEENDLPDLPRRRNDFDFFDDSGSCHFRPVPKIAEISHGHRDGGLVGHIAESDNLSLIPSINFVDQNVNDLMERAFGSVPRIVVPTSDSFEHHSFSQ